MFKKKTEKKSVAQVVSSLTTIIDDLAVITALNNIEALDIQDQIKTLEDKAAACAAESEMADKIAGNLRKLVS